MRPQQLYELWERQQWQSQAIDLERDKRQWAELSDADKEEPRLRVIGVGLPVAA